MVYNDKRFLIQKHLFNLKAHSKSTGGPLLHISPFNGVALAIDKRYNTFIEEGKKVVSLDKVVENLRWYWPLRCVVAQGVEVFPHADCCYTRNNIDMEGHWLIVHSDNVIMVKGFPFPDNMTIYVAFFKVVFDVPGIILKWHTFVVPLLWETAGIWMAHEEMIRNLANLSILWNFLVVPQLMDFFN